LDDEYNPRIGDFGLVVVGHGTDGGPTATKSGWGTVYWLAPELLDQGPDEVCHTKEADTYAYGCLCYTVSMLVETREKPYLLLCYEMCVGSPPFKKRGQIKAPQLIMKGERPPRPTAGCIQDHPPSDELWRLTEVCWAQEPNCRPSTARIVELWEEEDSNL
jgi:serine/threonine protein kinase